MFFKNLKIKTKLLLSFAVVILFLGIAASIGVFEIYTIKQKSNDVYQKKTRPLETLEHIKSEYAELRRMTTANVANGISGDVKKTEQGINDARKQYAALQRAAQNHVNRLMEAKESQQRIDTATAVINRIYDEYWPIIEEINAVAMTGDSGALLEDVAKAAELADDINVEINALFANKMTEAGERTAEIMDISQKSMLMLMITSILAIIISLVVAIYMGRSTSNSIVALGRAAKEISKGNLDLSLTSSTKDELGELTRDLASVVDSINGIMSAINQMHMDFQKGNIEATIDTSEFDGVFKVVAANVGNMFQSNVQETLMFMNCVMEFSKGNFNADLPTLSGGKAIMNTTLDGIRSKLNAIISEINTLVAAAASGKLSNRISSDQYEGAWLNIMNGLNQLMEAVATPISEAEMVLEQIAAGNFDQKVMGNYQGDFLLIKKSINDMVTNIGSYIGEISDVLNSLSQDNLNQEIKREYVGKFSDIKTALNNIIDKFNHVIVNIAAASGQVADDAKQISESSMTLAEGAAEQAAAVQELNATVQMIHQNTLQNAESAQKAEDLSNRSKSNAGKGDQQMKNMLASMTAIKESSNSISKIIKVIDDIAFQTNLLALNAAVEAARAGAHGKGFAVVAEEVRNLAGRSQNAAKETAQLIEESINRVDEGTMMAGTTAGALQTIVEDVTKVADIITDITAASEEQAMAISQVTEGLSQITEVVQNNSATSEEAAASSQQLSGQAEMLQSLVHVFKLK